MQHIQWNKRDAERLIPKGFQNLGPEYMRNIQCKINM